MKKHFLFLFFALVGASFFLTNCASLTGFQDGRTVGKDNGEFSVSLNFAQSPDFDEWEDSADSFDVIPNQYFGNIEFGGRYGVAEKVDLTLRLNTSLNLGIGVKAQVVGDQESKFALAVGAEVGTFALVSGLWNVQIPVFLSVHPAENLAWYLSPRYIYQFTSYAGADNGLSYVGGNTGLLFGKRHKFGLDVGYYRVGTDGERIGALQIGLGGKFAIGGK